MKHQKYILISPDIDVLYSDEEGCCYSAYGDEICLESPELGPRFSIVMPGIEEWLKRYEKAAFFAEATTDPSFDWRAWHYEGLCFAKAIREQLPRCYSLYYKPPYEDRSNTISKIKIEDNVDDEINRLKPESVPAVVRPSFTNNVKFSVERKADTISVSFKVGNAETDVEIRFNSLTWLKSWLKNIIEGRESTCCLDLPSHELYFFRQVIGSHPEMGEFWIIPTCKHDAVFQAYVNIKDFIKGIYLSVMTRLGFMLYDDINHYPSGEERERLWVPYNSLKSGIIESFISGQSIKDFSNEEFYHVNESFVMFPDYGGCIFWDTMGVGSGDFQGLLTNSIELNMDVPGLEKWSEFYDNPDEGQTFVEYWKEGWELAKKIRKLLPKNIDLFYMCYDPSHPEAIVDYHCTLPKIIVPSVRF